ncbi:SH3 domain-containing protein [Amycolatopsis thailandensis]|uniref:hypothetical protein n=1 Tax=Amycolatopsis thailandensis TaxID=589330 RepID=UPI00363B325A
MTFEAKPRRFAAAVLLATAGLLVASGPGATAAPGATATPEGTALLAPAKCADYGWVKVIAQSLSMRSGPGLNYPPVGPALQRGHRLSCFPVEAHGSRYDLCGYSGANGWIPIDRDGNSRRDAYVPSTCVVDD